MVENGAEATSSGREAGNCLTDCALTYDGEDVAVGVLAEDGRVHGNHAGIGAGSVEVEVRHVDLLIGAVVLLRRSSHRENRKGEKSNLVELSPPLRSFKKKRLPRENRIIIYFVPHFPQPLPP